MNEMGNEWERMSGWRYKETQAYRDGLKVNLQIENLLRIITEFQGQVLFARAIVTNQGYVLSVALVSLTKRQLPAACYRHHKLGILCQRWNKRHGSLQSARAR